MSREKSIKREIVRTIALPVIVLAVVLSAARPVQAQDAKAPYPSMAPIEQYLMNRDAEIALARSAAPESISRDAEVMVLGKHGYETAVRGKNSFVCNVGGLPESTLLTFGIPNCAALSASTRQPCEPIFQ